MEGRFAEHLSAVACEGTWCAPFESNPEPKAQGPIVSKGGWGAPQSYHFAAWLIRLR